VKRKKIMATESTEEHGKIINAGAGCVQRTLQKMTTEARAKKA
jgi:hypothetical protein